MSLAQKLKGVQPHSASVGASAIFGSVGGLAQAITSEAMPVRVGLWPIQSADAPEIAIGLGVVLSYLLECWPGVVIYRLMARVEGEPQDYRWSLSHSQFAVDEWQIDDLNENVAIWGSLKHSGDCWEMTIEAENDLSESDETFETHVDAPSIAHLVETLPSIADQIASFLELGNRLPTAQFYTAAPDQGFDELLKRLFDWELKLYLHLWGQPWPPISSEADFDRLLNIAEASAEFGAWAAAQAFSRALSPQFELISQALLPKLDDFIERFPNSIAAAVHLSRAIYPLGYSEQAVNLLESVLSSDSSSDAGWLTLADLYWRQSEYPAAIFTLQRAIEQGSGSADVFLNYGDRLSALQAAGIPYASEQRLRVLGDIEFIEQFILIEPQDKPNEFSLLQEAAKAYEKAVALRPDDVDSLYQWCSLLLELRSPQLWSAFHQLVSQDTLGQRTQTLVEALYILDDVSPAERILETMIQQFPERVRLRLSLASLYLLDEAYDRAEQQLEVARDMIQDDELLVDIERLMLMAADPEFEARFGEIEDRINAGATLAAQEVEFLEKVVERAPHFAPGYVALASAYDRWQERGDALDVLLDGQKQLPDHPEILLMLGRLLWEMDEQNLALDYLNKGLRKHPNHVGLLALTGRYLFDNGQYDAARTFLARAERLDPRHSLLAEVRAHIAREISKTDS